MRWILRDVNGHLLASLPSELRDSPVLRGAVSVQALPILSSLLVRGGITDADSATRFLTPSLSHLHPPEQMSGIPAAVDRIDAAIERQEPILIYGDYDVDATMAFILPKTPIHLCGAPH